MAEEKKQLLQTANAKHIYEYLMKSLCVCVCVGSSQQAGYWRMLLRSKNTFIIFIFPYFFISRVSNRSTKVLIILKSNTSMSDDDTYRTLAANRNGKILFSNIPVFLFFMKD